MATLPRPIRPAAVAPVPEPVPQRADRKNFAVRGDAVLTWMPGGMAGVNSNIGYLKDSLDYIDQEVAATEANVSASQELLALTTEQANIAGFTANYKGAWSSLAGALNKPASVSHGGLFWLLENNLANVATSEPGMTSDWTRIPGVVEVATPINSSPAAGATNVGASSAITLSANAFGAVYVGDTHASSQWQVHTSNAFAFPLYDSGEVSAATSHTVALGVLAVSTGYYWRVRYKSSRGTWSAWSRSTSFTTAAVFNSFVPTPTATPALGGALEGGFYGGLVWNQLSTSTSTVVLGPALVGTNVTIVLPVNMHVTPLVYAGQYLDLRTSNPDVKLAGNVVSATGTLLTLAVTGVVGTGSFSSWSLMSKYRIIVAPKAAGETTSLAYKNAATATPTDTQTLVEGWRATTAMVAAGNATVYPMANWARGLSINGYTDWYVPARDEFEVLWRNLKPVSGNSTGTRPAAVRNYQNRGAYADASNANGTNLNSSPGGAAYTLTVPGATAAVAFQSGGSEALQAIVTAGSGYMTSTESSDSAFLFVETNASNSGLVIAASKTGTTTTSFVRAVRRSMI